VTRGRLPQSAGSPNLNGGGAATAVPQHCVSTVFICCRIIKHAVKNLMPGCWLFF